MAEETKIKSLLNQLNSNIKRLIGNTDDLEIKADTLNLNTDTLEALIATSNQLLTTISGNNVDVSLLAKESTLAGISKEETLGLIKAKTDNLDITLTALKNFLRGANNKDFTTLETAVEALLTELALKAKKTEIQPTSNTNINILLSVLRDALIGVEGKNFTTLENVIAKEATALLIKTSLANLLIENEAPLQIDVVGVDTYVGYANPGTATSATTWAIKKITETGDDVSTKWADGNRSKDNVYDNRLTLIYN